jgi:enoyl-CoA hydratase/carnithine racemase
MKTDYKTIVVDLKDGVAVFTLNNPPVNQLSEHFVIELAEAITEAYSDDIVKAIVLTGTGQKIKDVKTKDEISSRLKENMKFIESIETGSKPMIAAINGNCLGGGLEIAQVCHYRVATSGVNLGQPEVQIGLIPGLGGTQRLPRLIGLPNALEMITTGKPITAEKAYTRGLVDEVVEPENLVETAVKAAGRFISGELKLANRITRYRHDRIPSAAEKKALIDFSHDRCQGQRLYRSFQGDRSDGKRP